MNAYLTPSGRQTITEEAAAHIARIAQLREARDRRGAPVMREADAETQQMLDSADARQSDRRFSGDPVTAMGALS